MQFNLLDLESQKGIIFLEDGLKKCTLFIGHYSKSPLCRQEINQIQVQLKPGTKPLSAVVGTENR